MGWQTGRPLMSGHELLVRRRATAGAQPGGRHGPSEPMRLPGGRVVPSSSAMQQPPPNVVCLERTACKRRESKNHKLLDRKQTAPFAVVLAVQRPEQPLLSRRRRSGARPVWKTIIHVLLALSSTLDLLRFKFPPLHRVHRNFFNLSFLAAALSPRHAPTAP
jgi:hypothetical protein